MEFLEELFVKILNMGLTAGYVIAAILILRFMIRKMPKKFSYYLWGAAGFRLLCPFSFSSVISFFNLGLFRMDTARNSAGTMDYIPANVGLMPKPEVTVGIPIADQLINRSLPTAVPVASINPMQVILFVGTVLWLAGIAVLLVYSAVSYLRIRKYISKAVLLRDNVYECDRIPSPFVLGFIKPRIYIPFHLKENELDYILRHEQYHIGRLDHLTRPFSFLLLIVYWFHPLVWIAYFCTGKDMEMSCDEKVLSELGASVKDAYSRSLLSFAANYRFPAVSPLAFGESNTRGRIKNILHFKRPNWWVSVAIGILCVIVVLSLAANPSGNKNKKDIVPASDAGSTTEVTDLAQQLFECRNPYIGDAPADGTLIKTLGIQENFGNYSLELETKNTPYVLRIVFKDAVTDRDSFDLRMFDNAAILLALINNADEIQWSYPYIMDGQNTQIIVYYNLQNTEQIGIRDIKSYGESAEKVQELMDFLKGYYGSTSTAVTPGAPDNTAAEDHVLTVDGMIAIKDWNNFTLDYFKGFQNAAANDTGDPYALNAYYMFELTYDGKPFELQVSYMKADLSIDSILLLNKTNGDAILLYTTNPSYRVNTDITSFLQKHIEMDMYLSYKLPDGFVNGPYTATLMAGGNLILKDGEQLSDSEWTPVEWYAPGAVMRLPYDNTVTDPYAAQYVIFKNGKLVDGDLHNNHTWYLGEPETLKNAREQAILKEVNHDLYTASDIAAAEAAGNPIPEEEQTSTMWEIYFAREDGKAAYCISLNEKYFTKEQAIALAESVQFTEEAFR